MAQEESDHKVETLLREMRDLMRQQAGTASGVASGGQFAGARFRRGPKDRLPLGIAVGILVGVLASVLVAVPDDEAATRTTATGIGVAEAAPAATGGPASAEVPTAAGSTPTASASPAAAGVAPVASGGRTAAVSSGSTGAVPTTVTAASTGPTRAVRGITATKIKIGVGIPEKALEAVIGDVQGYYEAILDEWRRTKQIPVNGRDVEFVFNRWAITAEGQRASCVALAQDAKVFAAIGWGFSVGADCMAKEFKVPVVSGVGSIDDDTVRRGWPYLFWTNMSTNTMLRNWPHWAHEGGHLKDKKIGLFYADNPTSKAILDKEFKPQLAALGYKVTAEATQGEQGSEVLAVQRLRAAGVQTVFLMTNPGGFTQAAQAQAWKPNYLLSEYDNSGYTADGVPATQGYVPSQLDGAFAMSYYRRAENGQRGNPPEPPPGKACVDNYARWSKKAPYRKTDPQESIYWDSMQHACDQGRILMKGLQAAGPDLTELKLVQAFESTVKTHASGEMADITFSAQKHTGAEQLKTLKFSQACICWNTASPFRPAWVR